MMKRYVVDYRVLKRTAGGFMRLQKDSDPKEGSRHEVLLKHKEWRLKWSLTRIL
jgi:hypothetical protein